MKQLLRLLVYVLGIWFAVSGMTATDAHAQACPAGKFCYYIPAGLGTPPGYSVDWDLIIASSFGTVNGSYKIGTAAAVPFSVTPNTPVTVNLSPTEGVTTNYGVVEKRGIYIEADTEALNVVRRLIVGPWQSSASIKDHTRSLGTRFRLAGYSLNGPNTPNTGFDMVSVYSPRGATVKITAPPGAVMPYWEGTASDSVTVSLAAGETYILRTRIPGSASCDLDITGALVESSAPISVTTGGRGWGNAAGGKGACGSTGCGDDGEDHIFPTTNIGTQYVVNQYNTNIARIVAVIADEDGTAVSVNGASVANINAGQVYYFRPTGTTYIETSKNAYVYQNAGRNGCEMGLAFVPPIGFGSTSINTAAFNVSGTGTIKMLLETSKLATIQLDGNPVTTTAANTVTVPTQPQWSVVTINTTSGFHRVQVGGDFQMGLATGVSGTGLFAYYNIFSPANCGNSLIDPNEGCDDGNRDNGDGCSSSCKIEVGTGGCTTAADCVAGALCDPNGVCVECLSAGDCNDGNDCTTDSCNAGTCDNASKAAGDQCAGGVCSGNALGDICVTCIDSDPDPGDQDLGCPAGSPVCDTSGPQPRCVGCTVNADCNDGNECTTDTCNAGACAAAPVAAATPCDGGNGVCNGSNSAPACEECIDDSANGQDSGCDASAPYCDRSGAQATCVQCLDDSQCQNGQLCGASNGCAAATVAIVTPADNAQINDDTPTVSGNANADESVDVVINNANNMAVFTATVPTDNAGAWTIDSSALPDGTYTVVASISANGGPVQDTHTFTIDTAAPAIALTAPTDGTLTSTSPAITGTAESGATVEVTITDSNGAVVVNSTVVADMMGNWSLPTNLIDGDYNVSAVATDAAGNSSAAAGPNQFTVDTQPPLIAIANVPSPTNDNTPNFNGISDPGTVTVIVRDDNGNILQTLNPTVDAQGDWSIDANALPDGDYTVEATATDAAGNTSQPAGPLAFTVDTVAPMITLTAPANGTTTNDNTPNIGGATEVGATVSVIVRDGGGNVVQTLSPSVDAQGNYSVDPAALADGTYTVEATATDAAGNTSTLAGPNTVTIDTTPPGVTLVTPVDGLTTNDNTLTISGSADAGSTLEVNVRDAQGNVVQTLSPMLDAQGNYSVDTGALPDGDYQIAVTATDAVGNSATTPAHSVTIDTAAPTVAINTPADASFTNDDTPSITGSAEIGTTVAVTLKDDQGNTVQTLSPTVDAQGNWTIDAAALVEGTYTVEAVATDAAGNTSPVAGPNTFEVDLTDPTVAISNPADGSFTADVRPGFAGTADAGSQVALELKDAQGNVVHTTSVTADAATGAWSVDDLSADLTDGDYTIEATATDLAGNTATTSNGFTVDTSALPLTIDTPTAGQALNTTTPDVTGTTAANTTVTLTVADAQGNTLQTLTVTSDAQGNWSTPLNMLSDGAYVVTAEVANQAGTVSTQTTDFTIDTMAPMLTIDTPTDGTTTNDDTPTISGTTEPGATVEVTITDSNGAVVQTLNPTVDGMGGWTIDAAQLPEGDYTISATATDGAGNQASQGPVALNIDLTAPALSITTPSMGELVGTRDVDVSGSSEPNQTMIAVEIIDANGVVVDTQTVDADANGDWTLQTQGLANGDYTARAKTSDAAGNEATAEQTFTVDSDEPLITIDAPAADTVTNEVRPAINGTADTDGVVTVVVTDGQGNEVANVQPTVDAQGNWTVALDADLADGDYTITATATRPNGKMASASVDVTIDTIGPDTTITAPADGMVGSDNQPEITGTTEPGAIVDVTVTNAAGTVVFTGQVTADDQGNWSVTPDNPLADDTYTINATSTDAAGNEGTPATSTFTVDTNAPMVTVTSPSNGDTIEDTTPTITGTAEPGATVTVIIDGMDAGQATADDQGVWSFDVTDELAEGDHTIEAKTTDGAGNEASSGELTVTVALPKAPIVITSPTEGGEVTGPEITITGTGEPGEEVTVTVGGETQTVTVDENGDWTVTFDNVPEGDQTINANSGDRMTTIDIKVVPASDTSTYVLQGAGCASTNGSPTSSLWLLGLVGLLVLRRRRRR